jgi:hypothetical protein
VPILYDTLQHTVQGPEYKRRLLEGERRIIHIQIEGRFGPLPNWQDIASATRQGELEHLADRILEVQTLDQIPAVAADCCRVGPTKNSLP